VFRVSRRYVRDSRGRFATTGSSGSDKPAVRAAKGDGSAPDSGETLHRGIGFRKGDLPPDLEKRVEAALTGKHDPALSEDMLQHLGSGGGENWWAPNPTVADVSGRQVQFRYTSDVQVSLSGVWDGKGLSPHDADPRYRKLMPGAKVDVRSVKVRRTPSGSWMKENNEGWVELARGRNR